MEITVLAPAKINLTLDITGKRDDGYHTLTTIMQSISLADIVTISESNDNEINVITSTSSIPSGENNIAYAAAKSFYNYTNIIHNGINIYIQKNIPHEAGLGGGSADAAAVLVGLNHIHKSNLSLKQLFEIGVSVGADVPFCIAGGTKICEGIGEIITDTSCLENCYIVISKGDLGISTKLAFKKIDDIGFKTISNTNFYNGTVQSIKENGYNRFEEFVVDDKIKFIKEKMIMMNAEYSAMTGSGSAVLGLFLNKQNAEECTLFLKENGLFACLCTPLKNGASLIS